MKDAGPRYWDGRVRQVVSVRFAPKVVTAGGEIRIETLTCGHEKVPHFKSHSTTGATPQWRVCWECPGSKKREDPKDAVREAD